MPLSSVEIFNKILDQNTLARLQAEDAAARRIFRVLNDTRLELYARLRAFEESARNAETVSYTRVQLAQTIREVNLTIAKMETQVTPAFREEMTQGYTTAQTQTFAELAVFERATPGFPRVFTPVAPTDAVLDLFSTKTEVIRTYSERLRQLVVSELQRANPNLSDAEALQAAGAAADRIKEAIGRGIVSGEGTASIARRLASPDGLFPRLANNTITRTVRIGINEAFNAGHDEVINETAKTVPGLGKCWLSALRRSTRICLDLHGQKRGIGEPFTCQGKSVPRPPAIGYGLSPSYHLCRSRVVPWRSSWPNNPKLDELTNAEKDHFASKKEDGKAGDYTDKQKGPGPVASAGAKAELEARAKDLAKKIKAQKVENEGKAQAAKILAELEAKKKAERAILARQKLIAGEKARLAAKADAEAFGILDDVADAKANADKLTAAKALAESQAKAAADKALKEELAALRDSKSGIREFKDQADLDNWAKKAYGLDDAPLMGFERAAVKAWQNPTAYKEIQAGLRGANNLNLKDGSGKVYTPAELLEKHDSTIESLDNLLGFHAAKEAFKVFRGFHGAPPIEKLKASVGGYYTEAGYTATTPVGTVAERFSKPLVNLDAPRAIMEIRVPKGTPNFYCNLVDDIGEAEILLGHGLEFRVISHEERDGINHFVVDVLTAEESKAKREAEEAAKAKPKRGRPPGSKNKPKIQNKYGLSKPEADFRKFQDSRDCDGWGLNRYSVSGYNEEQIRALRHYQGSGYRPMNNGLRGLEYYGTLPSKLLQSEASNIKALDGVLNEKPLDKPQYVVRGTDFLPLKQQILSNIGGEFYDPAYMSTTVEERVALGGFAHFRKQYDGTYKGNEGSLMWRMYMPEGTPAFYLNALENIGEAEILIGRGMKYRILHYEVIDGVDWVTVEGLPYEKPKA